MGKRIVTFEEYQAMSYEDQAHVTVVTFTGLTECGTLRKSASAEGTIGVVRAGEEKEADEGGRST